jgi:hypothetical protein
MKLLLLFAVLLSFSSFAQPVQKFEPGIISNGGVFGLTISPDGREAFWVQSNGGRDTLTILHSVLKNGSWSAPVNAVFSGNPGIKDIDPVFSPDGNTLLFQSTRPVDGLSSRTDFDIWAVKKEKGHWGKPYHLGNDLNSDVSESFASMTKSGDIYFMKENPDGQGKSDIWVSRFENGRYLSPDNIGPPINTSFRESNPFISSNGDFLIYFSSDTSGYGEVDLHIAFREGGKWGPSQNLGQTINTPVGEFCPFYHEKQKVLYFARTIRKPNGRREEDLFYVPFDVEGYRKSMSK